MAGSTRWIPLRREITATDRPIYPGIIHRQEIPTSTRQIHPAKRYASGRDLPSTGRNLPL